MKLVKQSKYLSCTSQLCEIRKDVREGCQKFGLAEQDINMVVLAVDEAYANVIRYGYNMCDDGCMELEVYDDEGDMVFHLIDQCPKISVQDITAKVSQLEQPGGLGLQIIHRVMDGGVQLLDSDGPGNILELRKRIG
jgi:anti-sigma regulatory factor (Ser/Thr protein kinase)